MAESATTKSKGFSVDWLVKGSLTKIGDILDRLTGRGWKPSSTLATSELIERMKSMMDSEVRENGDKRKYVPHNIKLKMQWDKFSTDSADALKKLENEFLIAAVDLCRERRGQLLVTRIALVGHVPKWAVIDDDIGGRT